MHRLISTIISICIAPENWLILLLILLFFVKSARVKKRITIAIVVLLLIFGNSVLFNQIVMAWQPKLVSLPATAVYDAGIVLGGSSSFDKYDNGYLNSSADRFVEICALYKTGKIRKIIVSGGSNHRNGPKDAQFQFKKMLELGIPAEDIIVEDSSSNTFENAAFTKIKVDFFKLKSPFVLVTSAMHIPRATYIFTKAGLAVVPFPCDFKVFAKDFSFTDYFIPSLNTVFSWSSFLKEVIGVAGYKLLKKA
jgi:uncharacterized SAM-binding protein YcdF (DUF218 family)